MDNDLFDRAYPERRFGGYTRVDGTVEFFTRVQAIACGAETLLDAGCGRGLHLIEGSEFKRKLSDFRAPGRKVIGIDVNPAASTNPGVDEYRQIEGDKWPVEDASVDVIVSNSVVEHLEDADAYFAECSRVLKPGGTVCVRTYNVWNYVGVASRLIPNKYHARVTSKVQKTRKEEDVFDTYYRCNTRRKLKKALERAGLDCCVYTFEAEPSYLQFSPILFRVGAVVHRWMPGPLRWALLGFGKKPAG